MPAIRNNFSKSIFLRYGSRLNFIPINKTSQSRCAAVHTGIISENNLPLYWFGLIIKFDRYVRARGELFYAPTVCISWRQTIDFQRFCAGAA